MEVLLTIETFIFFTKYRQFHYVHDIDLKSEFVILKSSSLLSNRLVRLLHQIATSQLTHTSLSSISLHSCGVFKDNFQQQQKRKTQLHMTSATKLGYDRDLRKKNTRLDMNKDVKGIFGR